MHWHMRPQAAGGTAGDVNMQPKVVRAPCAAGGTPGRTAQSQAQGARRRSQQVSGAGPAQRGETGSPHSFAPDARVRCGLHAQSTQAKLKAEFATVESLNDEQRVLRVGRSICTYTRQSAPRVAARPAPLRSLARGRGVGAPRAGSRFRRFWPPRDRSCGQGLCSTGLAPFR